MQISVINKIESRMNPIPKSNINKIVWPAITSPQGAAQLALMYQLEQSEWWTPDEIKQQQFRQLDVLLHHAFNTTNFYHERLKQIGFDENTKVTPDIFSQIPLLQREDIQSSLPDMCSRQMPKTHGKVTVVKTSGSTGKPVKIYKTSVAQAFWQAFTLRDSLWHKRDFSKKHGVIRAGIKSQSKSGWGHASDLLFVTGSLAALNIKENIHTQIKWMQENDPYYLLSYPSNLREMARICIDSVIKFPGLSEIRTLGESVPDEVRDICRQAWGVAIKDMYSSNEIGYMALQCPEHEHYHIMSEGVLLEVLNDDNQACKPGEIGKIVVTDLHNFATPIVRYEILDYAEVGEPCACGRGLPVLKRIMGRRMNMLKMPDGTGKWPVFRDSEWFGISQIRQFRIIQKEIDLLLIKLAVNENFDTSYENKIIDIIHKGLGYPFHIKFEYVSEIEKKKNLKFDFFVSEL
jgi:phenylacetate-CoA ligase